MTEDRDSDSVKECYGQRVLSDGTLRWPSAGRRLSGDAAGLCRGEGSASTSALKRGVYLAGRFLLLADGFIAAYPIGGDQDNGFAMQRFSFDLEPRWSQPVVLRQCSSSQIYGASIVTDEAGGAWILWSDGMSAPIDTHYDLGEDLRLQHVTPDGRMTFEQERRL